MKYLTPLILLSLTLTVYSQVSQQPAEPVQPPWFYYWPTEDPDNFQKSELGSSTLGAGSGLQRRSNIEVNRRQQEGESLNNIPGPAGSIEEDLDQPVVDESSRPPSSTRLIKWVDDKGVVHVTNDPGSIPEKYRDQIGK